MSQQQMPLYIYNQAAWYNKQSKEYPEGIHVYCAYIYSVYTHIVRI